MPDLVTAVPEGAFYVFPDVSAHFGKSAPDGTTIGGATDLCLYLLRCDALYGCAAFQANCVWVFMISIDRAITGLPIKIRQSQCGSQHRMLLIAMIWDPVRVRVCFFCIFFS